MIVGDKCLYDSKECTILGTDGTVMWLKNIEGYYLSVSPTEIKPLPSQDEIDFRRIADEAYEFIQHDNMVDDEGFGHCEMVQRAIDDLVKAGYRRIDPAFNMFNHIEDYDTDHDPEIMGYIERAVSDLINAGFVKLS